MNEAHDGIIVVNPLPATLRHYEFELCQMLSDLGCPAIASLRSASGQLQGTTARTRVTATWNLFRRPSRLRQIDSNFAVMVCWPIFGRLEPLLWSRLAQTRPVSIIVHDPAPLRRSRGHGRLSAMAGGQAARSGQIRIIVHSQPAAEVLTRDGWPTPTLLPHPILPAGPARPTRQASRVVAVVGQFKPVRDRALLQGLAQPLASRGYQLRIAGGGWPPTPGWETTSRYLSEQDLDRVIGEAACVLIPYRDFYQSGIAVRALEAGRPIVGPAHPFLSDLYGRDWPGLAVNRTTAEWLRAIEAVSNLPNHDVVARHAAYAANAREQWTSFLPADRAFPHA